MQLPPALRSPLLPILALALLAPACATTHLARPVGRGATRVNASVGGPIVRLGSAPIPVPLTTVEVAHGLYDDLDVHAGLHPFAALFNPNDSPGETTIPVLGMNLGFAYHPIARYRSALTLGLTGYAFSNLHDATLFTDLWIAGGGRVASWLSLSGGLHNHIRLAASERALSRVSPWAPTLFAQIAFHIGPRFTIDLEGRWYAFSENGARVAPNFVPIGQLGALGVLLGFNYQFGGSTP